MAESEELVEFLSECRENLDHFEQAMLQLEAIPDDRGQIQVAFRAMHSIKGTAGFFDLPELVQVAHAAENVLSRMRDGVMEMSRPVANALLRSADVLGRMMRAIEGGERLTPDADLIHLLEAHAEGRAEAEHAAGPAAAMPPTPEPEMFELPAPTAEATPEPAAKKGRKRKAPRAAKEAPPLDPLSDPWKAPPSTATPEPKPEAKAEPKPEPKPEAKAEPKPEPKAEPKHPEPKAEAGDAPAARAKPQGEPEERSIRLDVELLDRLMDLAGEIVLTRNQILRYAAGASDATFVSTAHRLNALTTELQERVMKTRMQPVRKLFTKLPRLVRDVAGQIGKNVQLDVSGEDTELDRAILESIRDPLTHLVRNGIDHGIEMPAEREAAGKPPVGRMVVAASHDSGYVRIVVSDDGRGMNAQRIAAKAVEKGLVTAAQVEMMAPGDILRFVFLPGFSTASAVSELSGRGVGMDVVKSTVEKLGGTVEIRSEYGHGSSTVLSIPLTLAILPAVIVVCGGDRYAVPQASVLEIVRLDAEKRNGRIEWIGDAPVYRLRGQLLSLVFLDRELRLSDARATHDEGVVNIVVVQVARQRVGIVVDRIEDAAEIVVKPLARQVKDVSLFSGATILSDGTVALILDLVDVARRARIAPEDAHQAQIASAQALQASYAMESMLVVTVGDRYLAVPLSAILRLEKLDPTDVEHTSEGAVIQYRDELMPLFQLGDMLGIASSPDPTEDRMPVLVLEHHGHSVGIQVDRALDIVEASTKPSSRARPPGILSTTVLHGRATDVVDMTLVRGRISELVVIEEVADAA